MGALLGLPKHLTWRAEQDGRWWLTLSCSCTWSFMLMLVLMPMPRLLTPTSVLTSSSLLLVPSPGLKGGKGGLGSQLKAIGIKVNLGEKIQFEKIMSCRWRWAQTQSQWGTWREGGSEMFTICKSWKSNFQNLNSELKLKIYDWHESTNCFLQFHFKNLNNNLCDQVCHRDTTGKTAAQEGEGGEDPRAPQAGGGG